MTQHCVRCDACRPSRPSRRSVLLTLCRVPGACPHTDRVRPFAASAEGKRLASLWPHDGWTPAPSQSARGAAACCRPWRARRFRRVGCLARGRLHLRKGRIARPEAGTSVLDAATCHVRPAPVRPLPDATSFNAVRAHWREWRRVHVFDAFEELPGYGDDAKSTFLGVTEAA
eukprot:3439673-Prymnesium_polylepis.1